MPAYNWQCQVCEASNWASVTCCAHCGCPAEVSAREIDARKRVYVPRPITHVTPTEQVKINVEDVEQARREDGSNIVPAKRLLDSIYLIAIGLAFSYLFLKDERAIIAFSTRARAHIEINGALSSFLGSLAMLAVAVGGVGVIVDHFDRRPNEHNYETFQKYCSLVFLTLMVLTILVGWQFEQIRLVRR